MKSIGEQKRGILRLWIMRARQWNVGRGQEATREACERAKNEGIDVLLVQEPYSVR